jgi:hypothetical protein
MARLSTEQGDRIKGIIDEDANLVGKYLEIRGCGDEDYAKFSTGFEAATPPAERDDDAYWFKLDRAWAEHVNARLLPENVVGACVVGGLFMAAFDGMPDKGAGLLPDLFERNESYVGDIDYDIIARLYEEFGLTKEMLGELQDINDKIDGTDERRTWLKSKVDEFVSEEQG